MPIHSVWNWKKGKYDYYKSPIRTEYRQRVGYSPLSGTKGVGAVAEDSASILPAGSTYVGSGSEAIGTISQPQRRCALCFAAVVGAVLALIWNK